MAERIRALMSAGTPASEVAVLTFDDQSRASVVDLEIDTREARQASSQAGWTMSALVTPWRCSVIREMPRRAAARV